MPSDYVPLSQRDLGTTEPWSRSLADSRRRRAGQPRRVRSRRPRRRWRRIIALLVVAALIPAAISYAQAMLAPSNTSLGVRSVEWLRGHGGAGLVSWVEGVYYSLNAPSKGGPGLRALPRAGGPAPPSHAGNAPATHSPASISPVIHPGLPGEGAWRPAGVRVGGRSPVLVTTFRPDPGYPRMVAGVARIDTAHARLALYPGRLEPPSAAVRGPLEVPARRRSGLLATFNSGFKLEDSSGGFYRAGHLDSPLQPGMATLVGYRDGHVDVRAWHGGARPAVGVAFARQNLPLIVDHGRLTSHIGDGSLWGTTVGGAVRVWRSGVGVDRHGNLIYAAADNQTAQSLARILVRAGAVRAMELDINSYWVSFITYGHRGAHDPTNLLAGMHRPATRYLTPDDRDFFAVFARGR